MFIANLTDYSQKYELYFLVGAETQCHTGELLISSTVPVWYVNGWVALRHSGRGVAVEGVAKSFFILCLSTS